MVILQKCENPKSVGILLRAAVERMLNEAKRTMKHAPPVVVDVVERPKVVAGGGAVEAEIARRLPKYMPQVGEENN